uniref:TRPM SLOG domain-containing protein n=1 Tax=Plectus sambesii TaxID=2011161 RepID=A0A914X0S4_9BILA
MSSRGSRAKRASHGDIEKASTEEFELLQRGTQNDANKDSRTIDFIKRNFKAKVCDLFTEQRPSRRSGASYRHGSAGSSEDQDQLCQCGFAKSDHATTDLLVADDVHAGADYLMADGVHAATIRSRASVTTKNTSSQRTRLEATPDRPTNAFGSITFHQSRMVFRKAAKYVRLSNESDMNRVVELMTEHWNLVKPEIKPGVILSVVGGGGHFRLSDPHKKTIFDEGLIKVMDMTNGWILSQGMNSGLSKAIGDAVREGQSFQLDPNGEITRAIHCIGIAPWNMIKGREGLIVLDENETTEVKYGVDQVPNLNRLNPDHSHFLFVDDGHTDEMKSILETEKFRAVVEERLRTDYPVVCLLIDGGYKSFLRVVDSLERGTSVLICKGTGRMANILAEAVTFFRTKSDWSDEESFKKSMKSAIESAIKSNLYLKDRAIVESVADDIKNIAIKYQNSLTVFDVDKEALDVTIMGFLDSKSKDVTNRLKLALRCSASASAASKIFAQLTFDDIQAEDRAELFKEALINDQVEFVKLFVDNHALNKDEFLNVEQLRNLYIETLQRQEALYMRLVLKDLKLWVDNGNIRLNHVHRIVKKFTRLYGDLLYFNDKPENTKDKDKSTNRKLNSQKYFDHPFRELFIWAVLFNRKQLALFFWENCPDPMSDALLGCLLCIGMKRKMQKLCEPFAEEFRLMKRY